MQFTRRSRKRLTINITSMIDVLFLLIIFFVVTSSFLEQPGMKLTKSSPSESFAFRGRNRYSRKSKP